MQLKGKKVAFLGDSIVEGVGVSATDKRFTDVFSKLSDTVQLNYGVGGTRIAFQKRLLDNPAWEESFIERVDKMSPCADVVVVFGGTNDFGHGDAPLGSFSDDTAYSFYGALHILYKKLIEKYPDANIAVMTPLHRIGENDEINEIGLPRATLKQYVEAIREVAEYYSLPVLDLFKNSGLQPSVDAIRTKYMSDGLHPSDYGAAKLAERLYNFLLAL